MNFFKKGQWIIATDVRYYTYHFFGFSITIIFGYDTVIRIWPRGVVPWMRLNEKLICPLQWEVFVEMRYYPYSYGYRSWCYIYLGHHKSRIREVHILQKNIFFLYDGKKTTLVVLPNKRITGPFDKYSDDEFEWVIHQIIVDSQVSRTFEYFYEGPNPGTWYDKDESRCWDDYFEPEDREKLDQDIEDFLDKYYRKDRRYPGYKRRRKLQKAELLKTKLQSMEVPPEVKDKI